MPPNNNQASGRNGFFNRNIPFAGSNNYNQTSTGQTQRAVNPQLTNLWQRQNMRQNQLQQSQMRQPQLQQGQMPQMQQGQMPPMQAPQMQQGQMPPMQAPQMQQGQMPPMQAPQMQQGQMSPMQAPQMQQGQMPPMQAPQMQQGQMPPMQAPQSQTSPMQTPQMQKAIEEAGITFEPLDPELLKKLQADAAKEDEELAKKVPLLPKREPPTDSMMSGFNRRDSRNDDIPRRLGELTQNERNGSIYYSFLKQMAENENQRDTIERICGNCKQSSDEYAALYVKYSPNGDRFTVKESDIIKPGSLSDGLFLAIAEESRALSGLCDLYESALDEKSLRILHIRLFKKISDLNMLRALTNNVGNVIIRN